LPMTVPKVPTADAAGRLAEAYFERVLRAAGIGTERASDRDDWLAGIDFWIWEIPDHKVVLDLTIERDELRRQAKRQRAERRGVLFVHVPYGDLAVAVQGGRRAAAARVLVLSRLVAALQAARFDGPARCNAPVVWRELARRPAEVLGLLAELVALYARQLLAGDKAHVDTLGEQVTALALRCHAAGVQWSLLASLLAVNPLTFKTRMKVRLRREREPA
jgi:hypothetical protein